MIAVAAEEMSGCKPDDDDEMLRREMGPFDIRVRLSKAVGRHLDLA